MFTILFLWELEKDGVAGYPLINAYLTGKELKLAAEVDASVSDFMTTARLYCSGLNFTFNPHRMILNKVTDCYLTREDGERIEIQDDQLYRVVTDLYTGQMLGSVMEMSYGLLKIEPKDKMVIRSRIWKIRQSWKAIRS